MHGVLRRLFENINIYVFTEEKIYPMLKESEKSA
jgi:hypothetical protein